MGTLKDELINKGLGKDSGRNPKGKGYQSPEDNYRKNLVTSFGENYIEFILSKGGDRYNDYINKIKKFVERNKRDFTTSQLRNIFARLKRIKTPEEVWQLRPNLAYISGRFDKRGVKELTFLLDELIQSIKKDEQEKLDNFKSFFEAIIAYRKFYGEK